MSDFELSSPSRNLLWRIRKGATLYRAPLSDGRRCYTAYPDGSGEWKTYEQEVRDLEKRGLVVALPRESKDEPTRFELTEAGKEFPL